MSKGNPTARSRRASTLHGVVSGLGRTRPRGARMHMLRILALILALTFCALPVRPDMAEARARTSMDRATTQTLSPAAVIWSDFSPADWVTTLPVTSSITATASGGLDTATAAYAISTDAGTTWDAWSTTNLTIGGAISTTQTISVTGLTLPDSANSNRIRFRIQEIDGALEISQDYVIAIDATPPAAPEGLQATPDGWTNAADFTVFWQNPPDMSDIVGAWYRLDAAPIAADDGTFVPSPESISGIAPIGDGEHPVYVWLQDAFGRADHTATAMTTLYLDQTPPPPPANLQGAPARTWTNVNRFSETWTNPPDLSGIAGAYYRINRAGQFPTDGIFISTTTTLEDIQVPADGKHDLYVWLVDTAGNTSHNNRNIDPQVFWYDGTAPVSMATLDPPLSPSGWYSTTVNIDLTAQDGANGSGVDAIWNQLDGGGWSALPSLQVVAEGAHQLAYFARDLAGNMEPTQTLTVSLDFSPPTTQLTPERLPAASGWYTAPVILHLDVVDPLSGGASGHYRLNHGAWQKGDTIDITEDGEYDIDFYGQDAAGNRSPLDAAQVQLDAIAPATAYLLDGTQGQNGWYTSPLTVQLIPSDAGSGVSQTFYRIDDGAWQTGVEFQLTSDGAYMLSFYSVDIAGNVETSFPVEVRLDTAAPAAPTAVQTTPAGWSRANSFSVQWANPTDLSGIAGVYYRLDAEPTAPDDGTFAPLANRLDGLTVPDEGIHRLYIWLRDGAGNADQHNRALAPLLQYDATPPTTTLRFQGVVGDDGWYRSPIALTLDVVDAYSGVASTRYRLNTGPWIGETSLALDTPGKHVLEYSSKDVAGNVEADHKTTLRIDPDAPGAPTGLRAEPGGWQHYNSFRLIWQEPLDTSGIAGAYVRFDGPPAGPDDGMFYPANEVLEGLAAPTEGRHDVYVWLQDRAGNSDHATAVALEDALWYDGTPPVTAVSISGAQGENDWYVGPVTLTATATDGASGLAEIRWQIDDGPLVVDDHVRVSDAGEHVLQVASRDNAGNLEAAQVYRVKIDQTPPLARMEAMSRYQSSPRFDVTWWGSDPAPGAGMATFDVQVRNGLDGVWENWLVNTWMTGGRFEGQRGHAYYFRVRARDRAGNATDFSAGDTYTVVDAVRNGDFDTGSFSEWTYSGALYAAVVPTEGPNGDTILAGRLGSPDYGPSIEVPGQVPVGDATIRQTITVPRLTQVARPTLRFWYRIFSYDVFYSERLGEYVDTLEVTLHDAAGPVGEPLLRTGNETGEWGTLHDTGWQQGLIDLTAYAGQTLDLVISNHNRHDNLFDTWSFVDGIQVQDWPYSWRVYMPSVNNAQGNSSALASSNMPALAETIPPALIEKR